MKRKRLPSVITACTAAIRKKHERPAALAVYGCAVKRTKVKRRTKKRLDNLWRAAVKAARGR